MEFEIIEMLLIGNRIVVIAVLGGVMLDAGDILAIDDKHYEFIGVDMLSPWGVRPQYVGLHVEPLSVPIDPTLHHVE